ncbi:MAG: ComEC/Rec2 family competence protein [Spirochaetaceae bacterium]
MAEPHHRPLVWAGGAAFFGFPLLERSLATGSCHAAITWLVPALALAGVAVTLLPQNRWRPAILIALSLAGGWFLAGSAALRLDHETALGRPRIPAAAGGTVTGTVAADGREGRGSEIVVPLRLERYTPSAAGGPIAPQAVRSPGAELDRSGRGDAALPISGELELRIRGGGTVYRGTGVSLRLGREELEAVAAGRRSVSRRRSEVILTPPTAGTAKLRGTLRRGIVDSLRRLGSPAGGLGRALLLGERSAVDPGLLELVRRAGAMHLLALSGMHLALLAGLLGVLLFPLLGRPAGVVASILLAIYFWIVGPIPSLLRALLMFSLGAAVKLTGRRVDPRSLLPGALLLAMLLAPRLAVTLGWRLSTLALGGILWLGAPLWARGPALPPRRLWSLLWVSLGAFLATTPISLSTFGEAYPASIVSSLLLTPLVLLFIWLILLSAPLLSVLPGLTLPLGAGGGALYALFERGAGALSRLRPLSGRTGTLIWAIAMGLVLVLLLSPWLRYLLRSRERRHG